MNRGGTSIHSSAKHDTSVAVITTGTYVGNSTENRAIPHGLGKTPKFVHLVCTSGAVAGRSGFLIDTQIGLYNYDGKLAVTGWDATNFYVGDIAEYDTSFNTNTYNYRWVAYG